MIDIDKTKYQLFICVSPTSFPLLGFLHAYIVANEIGSITRWDVWHIKNRVDASEGYVHENTFKPWIGLSIFYGMSLSNNRLRWPINIVSVISGEKNSLAYDMCKFINNKTYLYPIKDYYSFVGPNSNTFVQWFLEQFPESQIKLPFRAFGKSYKYKNYKFNS
jgi:hypothetical protein